MTSERNAGMLRSDTQGALVDAVQAVLQYVTGDEERPWESAEALCQHAMALVARDERAEVDPELHRPLTELSRKVLLLLQDREWVSADDLVQVTHRFGDTLYILRLNRYQISRRKRPRQCHEYKLVRGPGWPGWANGRPVVS
jgi:hypothetical protein